MKTKNNNNQKALHSILPYWEIWQDVVVLPNNQLHVGVAFDLPNTAMSSEGAIDSIVQNFELLLRTCVPENETLKVYIEKAHSQGEQIQSYLDSISTNQAASHLLANEKTERFFEERSRGELYQQKAYAVLSYTPPEAQSAQPKWMSKLLGSSGKHQAFTATRFAALRNAAMKNRERLLSLLHQSNIKANALDSQGLYELIYRWWNPNERKYKTPRYNKPTTFYPKEVIEKIPTLAPKTLNDQVAVSDIDNSVYGQLNLSRRFINIITMDTLPESVTMGGMFSHLLYLQSEHWLVFEFEHVPYGKQIRVFEAKSRQLRGLQDDDSGLMSDRSLEEKAENIQDMLSDMRRASKHPFNISLSIVLMERTETDLERSVDEAIKFADFINGLRMIRESAGVLSQFVNLAPASGRSNDYQMLVLQQNAADFIPLSGAWSGHEKTPTALFHNRYGTLTGIDLFADSSPNYNGLTVGGSGQGKSFFMQTILAELLKDETVDIVCVDKGASYNELAYLHSGTIIPFDPEVITINPFDLPEGAAAPSLEQKSFLAMLIRVMAPSDSASHEAMENALIYSAIDIVYKRHTSDGYDTEGKAKSVFEGCTLSDFVNTLKTMDSIGEDKITEDQIRIASDLSVKLHLWTGETPAGKFIDGKTNVDINSRVICFETMPLKKYPQLYNIGVMLVAQITWKRIEANPSRKKFIVIEEISTLLEEERAAAFIDELYRTLRKEHGAIYGVTQSLKDFTGTYAESILTNTSYHFLLPVPGEEALMSEVFQLPVKTVEDIASLRLVHGRGREVFAYVRDGQEGYHGGVIDVRPTPASYWAFTTKGNERGLKKEKITKYQGDVKKAIEELAAKYPNGL